MWQSPLQDQVGFTLFLLTLQYEVFCLAVIDHCKSEGTISSAAVFLV